MINNPKAGTHDIICYKCGKPAGIITHYGGENKLDYCEYCANIKNECINCFIKDNNMKKEDRQFALKLILMTALDLYQDEFLSDMKGKDRINHKKIKKIIKLLEWK